MAGKSEPTQMDTNVTSSSMVVSYHSGYFTTFFGKLTISKLVINLICTICIAAPWIPPKGWYSFVSISGLIHSIIELAFGIMNLMERSTLLVLWRFGLTLFSTLWSIFYLAAASAVFHYALHYFGCGGWYAGAVFGYLAMILYIVTAVCRFQDWKIVRSASQENQPNNTV